MINFIKKCRTAECHTSPVSITQINRKGKPHAIGISLSQMALTALKNPVYISIAIQGHRMYIASMSSEDGFKLDNGKYRKSCRIKFIKPEAIAGWIGDYMLNYDAENKLYYIDRQEAHTK